MTAGTTTIIAEMAWAHDGSVGKAIEIMKGASAAGADAIGIHITDLPSYMVPHYGSGEGRVSAGHEHMEVYNYLQSINLSYADWRAFTEAARAEGIALCVMPNDLPSLAFCEAELGPEYYVLTAAAFAEHDFIEALARTGRPTLFRIGGATLGEIEAALNLFRASGGGEVTLLHGFQNYPTKLEDTNIRQLATLAAMFDTPVGLADHIDGADPLAKVIPVLALACGARCVEKHITFDRAEKGEDFEAALNPSAFAEFVRNVRAAETALGRGAWGPLSDAEKRYRSVARKRTVAARAIPASTCLGREDLAFKRADVGLYPDQIDQLIGRETRVDLAENDGIEPGDLR